MAFLFPISYIAVAIKSRQLATRAFADESICYRRKQARKSLLYALLHPKFARDWFGFLDSPEFVSIYHNDPRIYIKPFRVYMSVAWTKQQKVKVIRDTYRFIRQRASLLVNITTGARLEIARIRLGEHITGALALGYDYKYRKEGELVLFFECEPLGGTIAAAAFSLEEVAPGHWVCRIGCIQGHRKQDSYPAKEAQKLLHGLRPKSLLLFSLQELSRHLCLHALYGAGDAIQAYRHKHAIHIQCLHSIPFDYDRFWIESDGKQGEDGWFEMPLSLIRKNSKDIKTSKRALYKRRYQLLDSLSIDIERAVKELLD